MLRTTIVIASKHKHARIFGRDAAASATGHLILHPNAKKKSISESCRSERKFA